MGLTTPRYVLRYPVAADADNVPLDMLNLATDLDNKMVGYSQGTLASRPAAGVSGREYRATDTGQVYIDIGTAWLLKAEKCESSAPLAYNAAWPTSPLDGQICYRYSDSTKQAIWQFKYDSAGGLGTNRWLFIGGAPYILDTSRPLLLFGGARTVFNFTAFAWQASATATYAAGVGGYFDFTVQGHTDASAGYFQVAQSLPSPGLAAADGLLASNAGPTAHAVVRKLISAATVTVYVTNANSVSVSISLGLLVTPVACS
jgi:hypothetical protein